MSAKVSMKLCVTEESLMAVLEVHRIVVDVGEGGLFARCICGWEGPERGYPQAGLYHPDDPVRIQTRRDALEHVVRKIAEEGTINNNIKEEATDV